MSRQSACANRRGVNPHGPSASVPLRVVTASVLALLAGGTSVLAQPALPAGPGGAPAPIVAPPEGAAPATIPGASEGAGLNQLLSPTQGFPDAAPAERAPTAEPKEDSQVKVDDNLVVDLHVNDEELANVLQMLSIQSQRNIVASNSVNARVKADLYGVTFYEALDAILHVNGYGYIDRGNFIYVYTLEELQQIEKASRVRVSKVIKLNYLNSTDAAEFVKPLLSEGAQIKTNGKTKDFAINNVPMGADEFAHDATLVVYDYEENLAEIEKLVRELDTRPAQVLIEATILQTQLNEANAFGVDFAIIADLNFLDFATVGGPESVVNNLISGKVAPDDDKGGGIVSTPGNTAGRGTMKLGVLANDVAAFVKLLDETSDTTIISNPKVLALNRAQTRVLVGRKVGYLSTTSTDTTTTQSVEFLDTGTQLTVRPFISADGMIRMELKPQVSEAVIRDTRDATGAAVTIPDEITNELNTNVMVRDGQTIVLGGLFRESTQATRRQVPFLGDIPLVGAAFRGNDDETNRSEIIFLITPSVVNDNVLLSQGEAAKDYVERARAGSREGLLPWSREKMTSMSLVEAQKLAANGETQKALWKIQQSLTLNPAQPDAIAMRERLTNEKDVWPSRNLLDLVVHDELMGKPVTPQANMAPPIQPPVVIAPPAPPAPESEPVAEPVMPVADATPSAPDVEEGLPGSGNDEPAPVENTEVPTEASPAPQPEAPGSPQASATEEVSQLSTFSAAEQAPAVVMDDRPVEPTDSNEAASDPVMMSSSPVVGEVIAGEGAPAPVPQVPEDTEPVVGEPVLDPHAEAASPAVELPESEMGQAQVMTEVVPSAPEDTPAQVLEGEAAGAAPAEPQVINEPASGTTDTRRHVEGSQSPRTLTEPVVAIAEPNNTVHAQPAPVRRSGAPLRGRPSNTASVAHTRPPVGQSASTSQQSQNLAGTSSDHLTGNSDSPAPDGTASTGVVGAAIPGGGAEAGERVASAMKVVNRSWQILRVFRPGPATTDRSFTHVEDTGQASPDR